MRVTTLVAAWVVFAAVLRAQHRAEIPSQEEQHELLKKEPMSIENWPTWRDRLTAWAYDHTPKTNPVFNAGQKFVLAHVDGRGDLPMALAKDSLAWALLGRGYGARTAADMILAEQAFRKSLQLDATVGWVHRDLAWCLLHQDGQTSVFGAKAQEAMKEMQEATALDKSIGTSEFHGVMALIRRSFAEAEALFREAQRENPESPNGAIQLAMSIVMNPLRGGTRAAEIKPLVDQHPDNGPLACYYAAALAQGREDRAASKELERARGLGTDPVTVIGPRAVQEIEQRANAVSIVIVTVAIIVVVGLGLLVFVLRKTRRPMQFDEFGEPI